MRPRKEELMARIRYAGEVFEGYGKPKRTPGESKKFAVLVKDDGKERIVRGGTAALAALARRRGGGDPFQVRRGLS